MKERLEHRTLEDVRGEYEIYGSVGAREDEEYVDKRDVVRD